MVGVQGNKNVISLRQAASHVGQQGGTQNGILDVRPEMNFAPFTVTWMIPSERLSARPLRTAFNVVIDDTFTAGKAKASRWAKAIMAAYWAGVAIGMKVDSLRTSTISRKPNAVQRPGGSFPTSQRIV